MTANEMLDVLFDAVPVFCFGYPFVSAWYWMAGAVMFYLVRERYDRLEDVTAWPPISVLVPCYNEGETAEETLSAATAVDYPDFEVIAINDGSRDNTGEILDRLASRLPNLRVVHLAANQGKATALNIGALLARHEILVGIDGDALLDPQALRWLARAFRRRNVGAMSGNPRIRNRTSLLGHLQVGEFSSIVGLIRRTQAAYGRLFTVSGVICAFRKRALEDAGWWSPRTITEDIDITWRIQLAGWRVIYEPNALVWILMPETLRGLWRQRLRWAEGGAQMMVDFFRPVISGGVPSLIPTYINCVVSVLWAYTLMSALGLGLLEAVGLIPPDVVPTLEHIPARWGLALTVTYLLQAAVSHIVEQRYEPNMLRSLFWVIWYPLAFWIISTVTTVVALPRALFRPRKERTTWVSPDRGLR